MKNLTNNSINLDTSNNAKEAENLEWIVISDEEYNIETFSQKMIRKAKENPAIPMGMAATIAALFGGLWQFYKGDSLMSNYMMRVRVAAQTFTFLSAAVGYTYLSREKEK